MNFYFEAAKVLDRLEAKQGSIKGIIGSLLEKDRKRTTALVIETLKYKAVLSDVIKASNLLKEERQKLTSANLALLLVHDLLLSRGIQAGDGPIKQAVLRHKTRLHAEFTKIKIKRGAKSESELAQRSDPRASRIPRYVRVNRNLWSTEDALRHFEAAGYIRSGDIWQSKTAISLDAHIPDLLLFNPHVRLHEDAAYKAGKIILQDKASCFPAAILSPPATDQTVVIDATAAPGNKTSHLSALMRNRGKVYAFERDKKRYGTLRHMLATAKCTNVEPVNADFLTVDPRDAKYATASHILLDPSCSGSGIVNRLDYLLDSEENDAEDGHDDRLTKLAAFQLQMIRHAMKFPAVAKIVYSTCSIHAIENEHVVSKALASPEAITGTFILAPRTNVLPSWHRRGIPEHFSNPGDAESAVRCAPGDDATNGFFVSCFVRATSDASSEPSAHTDHVGNATKVQRRKRRAEGAQGAMSEHGGPASADRMNRDDGGQPKRKKKKRQKE